MTDDAIGDVPPSVEPKTTLEIFQQVHSELVLKYNDLMARYSQALDGLKVAQTISDALEASRSIDKRMYPTLQKHVGHDLSLVHQDDAVVLRCKTCSLRALLVDCASEAIIIITDAEDGPEDWFTLENNKKEGS